MIKYVYIVEGLNAGGSGPVSIWSTFWLAAQEADRLESLCEGRMQHSVHRCTIDIPDGVSDDACYEAWDSNEGDRR